MRPIRKRSRDSFAASTVARGSEQDDRSNTRIPGGVPDVPESGNGWKDPGTAGQQPRIVKRPYFFGYLFVRAAKPLALIVLVIGIGFSVLQYSQANVAASAAAYRPSGPLQRALATLKDAFSRTAQIINAFDADNRLGTPEIQVPRFPPVIDSSADFERVGEMLVKIDQQRQEMKQSVVSRFDDATKAIEAKLRAYAATLHPPPAATPTAAPTVVVSVNPYSGSGKPQDSLFSPKLSADEVSKRTANLNSRKEFLLGLASKAENPTNRATLNDAAAQLDDLSKLLPDKGASIPAEGPSPSPSAEVGPDEGRKILPSEQTAGELEQLRAEIRQTMLTSWTVDEAFEQAADLTSVEREKCRVAVLAQQGIWLSVVSKILPALLAAVLVSFLIVVCADLVKTLLDTASHTGVLADAINALRGSVVTSRHEPQSREP